jgi:surfactin synthase thioesterase subunit
MGRVVEASQALRILKLVAELRARLVCVPDAGNAASLFHGWSREVPGDVELRAFQLPARQDRRARK